jgi:hypothetical protein
MQETGAASAENQKESPGAGYWKQKLVMTEGRVNFLKNLSLVSVAGAILGSYFQFVTWREEQNIARYKEDFAAATSAFTEISGTMSQAMNLQQILYALFYQAIKKGVDQDNGAYLTKSARDMYKEYVDTRLQFRERIDFLARKLEISIDWASDPTRDRGRRLGVDPMSRENLGFYDFDCDHSLPNDFEAIYVKKKDSPDLRIDWGSAKHHAMTFHYCFERAHNRIELARQWASGSPVNANEKMALYKDNDATMTAQNRVMQRLTAFMRLGMLRIEQIRIRYQTNNYACHTIGVFCK